MKKQILLLVLMLLPVVAKAYDVCIDGIYYYLSGNNAKVTHKGSSVSTIHNSYSDSVVIPSSVTFLGKTYTVTSIDDYAFDGCSGLTSITIPNSVTSIGREAFYKCSSLTSITIPNSVTSIGHEAFSGCSRLTSVTIGNSVTIIGSYAFENCSSLTSVTIPNSVTIIGNDAFYGCSGLTAVHINDLAAWCKIDFYRNSNPLYYALHLYLNGQEIKDLVIPDGVTSIGNYAFGGCKSLTSINIPDGVTSIGNGTFSGCNGLTSVTVEEGNTVYDSRNNCNAIIETATNTLIAGCQNTIIPNSVTSIGNSAFNGCSGLTSVTIPESVTSIGDYAFNGCSGLTSITIPNSVTSIGHEAFSGCSRLTSVTIGNSVTIIGSYAFENCSSLTSVTIPNSVTIIGNDAFYGCSGLTSVTIPEGVTSIGERAFFNCTNLKSVTLNSNAIVSAGRNSDSSLKTVFGNQVKQYVIGDSVNAIGNAAFYGCSGLTSVTIPNSVTSISSSAFAYCSNLKTVTLNSKTIAANRNNGNGDSLSRLFGNQVTHYVIGNSVNAIGNAAFYCCTSLTTVTIGNSVTEIGNYAFDGCSNLTAVHINDLAAWCKASYDSQPLRYAHHLYLNGKEIKDLVIPDGVKIIGASAFSGCTGLTSVTIPNSVICISKQAFSDCTGLISVTIPNSVSSIDNQAFSGCTGLTSVTIPNSVTRISYRTFSGCTGLTSVTIGSGVKDIVYAFDGCTNLSSVHITDLAAWCKISFSSYDSQPLWYAHHLYLNGQEIKDLVIPDGVTSIGNYVFDGCSRLTSITIPNSVTNIGEDSFAYCSSLCNVFVRRTIPPTLGGDFSNYSTLLLYVPTGCKNSYANANMWSHFYNIRETATIAEQLSPQQAYTLMDVNTFTYYIYDSTTNSIKTINSGNIDEVNPNHSWQIINVKGLYFLYNIGARKFVCRNGDSFELTATPKVIDMQNGNDGIIIGAQTKQQLAFVSNVSMNVIQSAINEANDAANVTVTISSAGYATFYDSSLSYVLPNGLSAQVVTSLSNNKLTYQTIAEGNNRGVVPKGIAVMLISDNKQSGTFTLTATGNDATYTGTNLLHGCDETTMTTGDGLHYKLSYGKSGTAWSNLFGWYWGEQNGAPFQIEGHKAWLVVPASATTRASGYTLDEGEATDIIDIESYNEKEGIYYDLQGYRINAPTQRGIYIKNGKKVFIK